MSSGEWIMRSSTNIFNSCKLMYYEPCVARVSLKVIHQKETIQTMILKCSASTSVKRSRGTLTRSHHSSIHHHSSSEAYQNPPVPTILTSAMRVSES